MREPVAPRRILFATIGFHVGGGIACVSRSIARALDEERRAGRIEPFDTLSLLDDPAGPPPLGPGVHEYARGGRLRFGWMLRRAIRRADPDLVVFDHVGLTRALHVPLLGLGAQRYALFAHGGELTVIESGLRRKGLDRASAVLTNSRFTADYLQERFPDVAERLHPVLLCINPDLIDMWERDPVPAPERREPAVLIVGRMWSGEGGKGHDALIAALPRIRERVPGAELWVVGRGDDIPRLEALTRACGVALAVRFLGGVSDRELGRLYRTAGVFAMPSCQEGFGLVYAEAMWHGLPCIGSTRDAAREVIRDGETGLLVPYDAPEALADAVVALLSDRERAERMGRAGAEDARQRFTYARFRRDLLVALGLPHSEKPPLL